jgi:hypothetical protein
VLEDEVLVGEALGAVDAGGARAVAVEEVAALAHEVADLGASSVRVREVAWVMVTVAAEKGETHDTVELAPLVALRPAQVVLGLAGAELAEVLGGLGDYVGEELELDAAQGFSCGRRSRSALAEEGDVGSRDRRARRELAV